MNRNRPTLALLCSHPAHFFSLGLGSGLAPKAPGTFGTLAGWLLFYPLDALLPPGGWIVFLVAAFLAGIPMIERTAQALGRPDPGAVVWDEMVAIWLVLLCVPASLGWHAAAFVAFRVFDILKPPPIRWADTRLKGGFGVMFDDLLAAGYALALLGLARLLPWPGG